jgi:hypothetical protein
MHPSTLDDLHTTRYATTQFRRSPHGTFRSAWGLRKFSCSKHNLRFSLTLQIVLHFGLDDQWSLVFRVATTDHTITLNSFCTVCRFWWLDVKKAIACIVLYCLLVRSHWKWRAERCQRFASSLAASNLGRRLISGGFRLQKTKHVDSGTFTSVLVFFG